MAEQGLGEIIKIQFIESYEGQEETRKDRSRICLPIQGCNASYYIYRVPVRREMQTWVHRDIGNTTCKNFKSVDDK